MDNAQHMATLSLLAQCPPLGGISTSSTLAAHTPTACLQQQQYACSSRSKPAVHTPPALLMTYSDCSVLQLQGRDLASHSAFASLLSSNCGSWDATATAAADGIPTNYSACTPLLLGTMLSTVSVPYNAVPLAAGHNSSSNSSGNRKVVMVLGPTASAADACVPLSVAPCAQQTALFPQGQQHAVATSFQLSGAQGLEFACSSSTSLVAGLGDGPAARPTPAVLAVSDTLNAVYGAPQLQQQQQPQQQVLGLQALNQQEPRQQQLVFVPQLLRPSPPPQPVPSLQHHRQQQQLVGLLQPPPPMPRALQQQQQLVTFLEAPPPPSALLKQQREQQREQQQQQQQGGFGNRTVFFAGVSPIAPPEDLLRVFALFGRVMSIKLFRPYRNCRTSKGCGLVEYASHTEAAAALTTLNSNFTWPGAHSPMSVEWCSTSKQQQQQQQQQQQ